MTSSTTVIKGQPVVGSETKKSECTTVDQGLLEQIDTIQLSPRLSREREEFFKREVEVTGDRSVLAMEWWKETEGDVLDVRWAKLVQKLAERLPIVIFKDQLVAGSDTKSFRGADPWVEGEAPNLLATMEKDKREVRINATRMSKCTEEAWEAVGEALNFFSGKTPVDIMFKNFRMLYGDWPEELEKARGILRQGRYNVGRPIPRWEIVLSKGLRSIIQEAQAGIEKVYSGEEPDVKKAWFWQAAIICCEAVIHYAHRYARLARELAQDESDPIRRRELEQIAESCEQVPEYPARTLQEAVQSEVVTGVMIRCRRPNVAGPYAGRVDQYLYPYFISDTREHRLTLEEASELIGSLLSNAARRDGVRAALLRETAQGTLINNVTLGGLNKDGQDANNELTYLVLHMAGLLKYAEPHYTFRVNAGTPRWVLLKAVDTNRKVGGGQPQFMSDDRIISYLVNHQGETLEDARDWMSTGCMQAVAGGQHGSRSTMRLGAHLNMALVVDMALHNGMVPLTGKRVGVETGDPRGFKSFEELWQAYRKQAEFLVPRLNVMLHMAHHVDEERMRYPLSSCLAPGCMEKGQDFLIGGLLSYKTWDWRDRSHVDVADSLMAVKTLVFDQKRLTMAELLEALDSNFAGQRGEEIRQMCLAAPKYGNDIEEVDKMVRESGKLMGELISRHKNPFGASYAIHRHGLAWHYYGGKGVGALPNGRKAGEPLNDGSLSPMRGTGRNGVTAVLRSAINAEFRDAAAAVLNQSFPLTLLQTPEAMEKLASLTQTFLTSGGSHIQYNILDHQKLLDAKKHPERYKDLIVRVGGYSAYWVHLTPEVQDEIIARTQQDL